MKIIQYSFFKFNNYKLLIVFVFFLGCTNSKQIIINDKLVVNDKLMYQNNFDIDLEDWVVEQMDGGRTQIVNRKLEIVDVSGCTIWLKKEIEGPIMIEYDAVVIDKGGSQDRVSDLNCFWMAKDPKDMNNLFTNSEKRGGKFSNYDSLRMYYMGVGGHNNTKTRFRRYVGNGYNPLLTEHDFSTPKYLLTPNELNKIRIVSFKGHIQYYRNNQLLVEFYDKSPYTSGHFGFRTVNNHMTVDNFKIYKLVN